MTALFTLQNIVALCTLFALTAYVIFGGADFGGGVWDALASGPRQVAQRELIAHTISPIWEANHVWLVLVVVLLFTCFSSGVCGDNDCTPYPYRTHAHWYRLAGLGVHVPRL